MFDEIRDESTTQVYKPGANEFLELVHVAHVALWLWSDVLVQPGHTGLDISEDAVVAYILIC